jgi:uncharacterized protein (TIGR03437 family)
MGTRAGIVRIIVRYSFIAIAIFMAATLMAQPPSERTAGHPSVEGALVSVFGPELATTLATADSGPASINTDGSGVLNGATNLDGGVVQGSWVTIKGQNFSTETTDWSNSSFAGGVLPTTLGGLQVLMNGTPAAIYFVNGTQANVQAPASVPAAGPVTIQVMKSGGGSNTVTVTSVPNAPGLFAYSVDLITFFPAATLVNGTLIGDPAVVPTATKVKAGDQIVLYATGLTTSPAGSVITSPMGVPVPVTVTIGNTTVTPGFAGLVAPGEFQINLVVPQIAAGNYDIKVVVAGLSSQAGVTLPVTQ